MHFVHILAVLLAIAKLSLGSPSLADVLLGHHSGSSAEIRIPRQLTSLTPAELLALLQHSHLGEIMHHANNENTTTPAASTPNSATTTPAAPTPTSTATTAAAPTSASATTTSAARTPNSATITAAARTTSSKTTTPATDKTTSATTTSETDTSSTVISQSDYNHELTERLLSHPVVQYYLFQYALQGALPSFYFVQEHNVCTCLSIPHQQVLFQFYC